MLFFPVMRVTEITFLAKFSVQFRIANSSHHAVHIRISALQHHPAQLPTTDPSEMQRFHRLWIIQEEGFRPNKLGFNKEQEEKGCFSFHSIWPSLLHLCGRAMEETGCRNTGPLSRTDICGSLGLFRLNEVPGLVAMGSRKGRQSLERLSETRRPGYK